MLQTYNIHIVEKQVFSNPYSVYSQITRSGVFLLTKNEIIIKIILNSNDKNKDMVKIFITCLYLYKLYW
jgi:hypothetical protein